MHRARSRFPLIALQTFVSAVPPTYKSVSRRRILLKMSAVDIMTAHRTVIVDGVDPLEKHRVAALANSRCGAVEKWWAEETPGSATIRLYLTFATVDSLGAIALLSGMRFGASEISCRLADQRAWTASKFTTLLAIGGGPSAAAAAASASGPAPDSAEAAVEMARTALREAAGARDRRAAELAAAQAAGVSSSVLHTAGPEVVMEATAADPAKRAAFIDDHCRRQAAALTTLTRQYIAMRRAELDAMP
jgi:hypothetical protein